jgi:hypothetical protein
LVWENLSNFWDKFAVKFRINRDKTTGTPSILAALAAQTAALLIMVLSPELILLNIEG